MTEHSKEEEEVNQVYQVHCYFKTNIEDSNYHVPETVISLASDFTRKKLNKIIRKLLEGDVKEKVKFEFLVKGEMIRDTLGSMMQKHHISNDETVEILYTFSMHKPKEDRKIENDEWIKVIHSVFSPEITEYNKSVPFAVGFFDGSVKIYDDEFNIVYNKQLHKDNINDLIFNQKHKYEYMLITAGNDEEIQLHKITKKEDRWVDKRKAMVMDQATTLSYCPTSPDFFTYAGDDALVKVVNMSKKGADTKEAETKPHKRVKTTLSYLKPTASMEGNKNAINCLKWINNSEIVSGGYDHAIRIFNVDNEELSRSLFTNNKTVTCIDSIKSNILVG